MNPLWLIEYYTPEGDIKFAWVFAEGRYGAVRKLREVTAVDDIILCGEESMIVKLALPEKTTALIVH